MHFLWEMYHLQVKEILIMNINVVEIQILTLKFRQMLSNILMNF